MSESRERHIVALGNGGFVSEQADPKLDDFLLELTGKDRPKVCGIFTASGDSERFSVRFYDALSGRADASRLTLNNRRVTDIRSFLLEQDLIYVGGGNTLNMLAIWRIHGVDAALREAWEAGVVLAGASAGSLCWFQSGITDSFGLDLASFDNGLGFLSGSNCPHYDAEATRRPAYHRFIENGLADGYAADDYVGLHYVGTELRETVTSRANAGGYRVERVDGRAVETRLEPRRL